MKRPVNKIPHEKPLSGKTLVVTRALTQTGTLSGLLRSLGAEVIEYPCIEIQALPDLPKKIRALGNFSKFTDLIFTSVNGVGVFFQALNEAGKKTAVLEGKNILAIGPKTNEALKKQGIHGSEVPERFQAEGLLELLPADLKGRSFLLPRAKNARELLPIEIKKRGGKVSDLPLYESVDPKNHPSLNRPNDGICFTSVSTVVNFTRQNVIRKNEVAFVIGSITAQSAKDAGFKKVVTARKATIESLVESIQKTLSFFLIFVFSFFMTASPSSASPSAEKKLGALVFFPWNEDWNAFMYPDWDTRDRDMKLLHQSGLDWVRLDFLWDKIEPRKGEWHFEFYDELLGKIEKNHLKVLGLLCYSALWANSERKWNKPPDDLEDYARFVSRVLERYPKIRHWEFWNEPDTPVYWEPSPWESAYVPLLKSAYRAAKKANPQCVILHGGLTQGSVESLDLLYRAGAKDFFDRVNIHPFVNPIDLEKRPLTKIVQLEVDQVLAVMKKYGDSGKKIWVTELGCPARIGEPWNPKNPKNWFLGETPSLEKQAQFAEDVVTDLIRHPQVEAVFWAFLRDARHFKNDTDYLGLLDWEGKPKPAYTAVKKALRGS